MPKVEIAAKLVKGHFAIDSSMQKVFLLEPVNEDDPEEPIKLLEVVEGTIERGIEPIGFPCSPEHGVDYPVVIVEISPREYQLIRNGESTLKQDLEKRGWHIGEELLAG